MSLVLLETQTNNGVLVLGCFLWYLYMYRIIRLWGANRLSLFCNRRIVKSDSEVASWWGSLNPPFLTSHSILLGASKIHHSCSWSPHDLVYLVINLPLNNFAVPFFVQLSRFKYWWSLCAILGFILCSLICVFHLSESHLVDTPMR